MWRGHQIEGFIRKGLVQVNQECTMLQPPQLDTRWTGRSWTVEMERAGEGDSKLKRHDGRMRMHTGEGRRGAVAATQSRRSGWMATRYWRTAGQTDAQRGGLLYLLSSVEEEEEEERGGKRECNNNQKERSVKLQRAPHQNKAASTSKRPWVCTLPVSALLH